MPSAAEVLDLMPAPWDEDRLVCSRRPALLRTRLHGDHRRLVTLTDTAEGTAVHGYGQDAPRLIAELVAAGQLPDRLRSVDLPRDTRLDDEVRDRLRLVAQPGWDWLWTETMPERPRVAVVALDAAADAAAILDCLAEANPDSWGNPGGADELGWWGVEDAGRLAGVIGATVGGGRTAGSVSWHLQGLAVRPPARGRGLGAALTAAATRAGLAGGADWVSLGVWASNLPAIRIYHRVGYQTGHRRGSYRRPDDQRAACNG